jgi:hypothetical protein
MYVDRRFRNLVIRRIHNDARRRVAPSLGFDLVPVVRHAWRSWLLDTGQQLATVGVLIIGLVTAGLLASVVVLCAVVFCFLLRGLATVFPEVFLRQVAAVSERWGRQPKRDRKPGPDLRSRKRLLNAILAGCLITLTTPWVASFVLGTSLVAAIPAAIAIGSTLVVTTVVAGTVRQLMLNALARAKVVRPVTLTRRERVIDEQQRHPCVIYHRPPNTGDRDDAPDTPTSNEWRTSFVGSGTLVNRWLPPLTVQLVRPGKGTLGQREHDRPPFTAHRLIEALRAELEKIGSDPGAENLRGLQVRDRLYVAADDFPADGSLVDGGLGKFQLWQLINDHQLAFDHFLETSVPTAGGELVATILIHASVKGRSLTLDVATCALARTPTSYRVIDLRGQQGNAAVVRAALRAVVATPADIRRSVRLFGVPSTVGMSVWARKDRTLVPRRRTIRPEIAVREKIADTWENTVNLDRDKLYGHMKIVEQRILTATKDFLAEHDVDTSVFEEQAISIINSGVFNMGQMVANQVVGGPDGQAVNTGSQGATA